MPARHSELSSITYSKDSSYITGTRDIMWHFLHRSTRVVSNPDSALFCSAGCTVIHPALQKRAGLGSRLARGYKVGRGLTALNIMHPA